MHAEVAIHSMNAYVWCWRKACGSLDEIPSFTMGTYKRKFLMNSNMTLTVLNLHQQTDPKVQQDFKGQSQSWGFTSRSTARVILGQVLRIATCGTRTHRGDCL